MQTPGPSYKQEHRLRELAARLLSIQARKLLAENLEQLLKVNNTENPFSH